MNAKANKNNTALMLAAFKGDTNCVKALIAAGADVNARNTDGRTSRNLAAEHPAVLAILQTAGAK